MRKNFSQMAQIKADLSNKLNLMKAGQWMTQLYNNLISFTEQNSMTFKSKSIFPDFNDKSEKNTLQVETNSLSYPTSTFGVN